MLVTLLWLLLAPVFIATGGYMLVRTRVDNKKKAGKIALIIFGIVFALNLLKTIITTLI